MRPELSAKRCREAMLDHSKLFAESVSTTDSHAVVPTCPDWTVRDLVEHVGQTQYWVSQILEDRIIDPAQLPTQYVELPADSHEWRAWLSEAASRATAACSDAAMEAQVFNAAGDDRTGGQFWLLSLLNEIVVHGYDAAVAAGTHRDYAIDADVAAELVSNHLAMLTSPTWAARRSDSAAALRGNGETLLWQATDEPGLATSSEWLIERRPDGATWQHRHDEADVRVHGPARSLLLLLTRRLSLTEAAAEQVGVVGEADLARHWIEHTAHVAD
jgi:uncharacterized protein (TIGR03083 family)